jgi:hypothetical protein
VAAHLAGDPAEPSFDKRVPLLHKIARTFQEHFSYLALFSTPTARVPDPRVDGSTRSWLQHPMSQENKDAVLFPAPVPA